MDFSKWLNDERLLANLIGIHVVLGAILVVSIVLRKLLKNGCEQVARWTGLHWLNRPVRKPSRVCVPSCSGPPSL